MAKSTALETGSIFAKMLAAGRHPRPTLKPPVFYREHGRWLNTVL